MMAQDTVFIRTARPRAIPAPVRACGLRLEWRNSRPSYLELAARLAPLREQGVMIVGSGNVVHNLKTLQWKQPTLGYDWAERFDDATVEQLAREPGDSRPDPLLRGHSMGSISMTCYGLEAGVELRKDPGCAALLPEGVPPEQTNM